MSKITTYSFDLKTPSGGGCTPSDGGKKGISRKLKEGIVRDMSVQRKSENNQQINGERISQKTPLTWPILWSE